MLKALFIFITPLIFIHAPTKGHAADAKVTYAEDLDLSVVKKDNSFEFIKIHNEEKETLFEIELSNLPYLIQTGNDLYEYQKRSQKFLLAASSGLGIYFLFKSIPTAILLGVFAEQIPGPDSLINKISKSSLPFLTTALENKFSSESSVTDVSKIIDSLLLIHDEYQKRMTPLKDLHKKHSYQNEKVILCGDSSSPDRIEVTLFEDSNSTSHHAFNFDSKYNREYQNSVSYDILIPNNFKNENMAFDWSGYSANDVVATITFDKKYLNVQKIELGQTLSPKMAKTPLDFRTLFANVGQLTKSVDTTLLINNRTRVKEVYKWASALKTCLH